VNNVHHAHLYKTSQLSGYTGPALFLLPERQMTDDEGDGEDKGDGSDELFDEVSRDEHYFTYCTAIEQCLIVYL
jgi:hypothetical protein